jgi:hypothetical protein
MGTPVIDFTFSSLAASAISRSGRGVVALVLRDLTDITFTMREYKAITDVVSTEWTPANLQYINDAFLGTPSKVIVLRGSTADLNYNSQFGVLATKKWNYLAIPSVSSTDAALVATWLKTQRDMNKQTFKVVLPNVIGDHEGIINFATSGIVVGANTYAATDYTARIAGILAGLSLDRSATFYVLNEIDSIPTLAIDVANTAIDAGKLILISDGEKVKIARGVNSFTTTTPSKGKDWSKIKVIEGHDLVQEDVSTTFYDNYVGKSLNSFDNQVLFLTSVNAYLRSIQGTVLDPNTDNSVSVDVEAQRLAWESIGKDTTDLTDQQIKELSFESNVFVTGKMKFLDAVEDLAFKISV